MLDARDITVSLGHKKVLHGVDVIFRAGALTAIVGPNGSGKTTLLRALTGDVPYRGRVLLDGSDVAGLRSSDLAARRAVLPQAAQLAFPFTVHEVVRLGLMAGIDGGRENLPEQALQRVGLVGFGGRFYHELSGGEQQRVQLARVLVQVWQPVVDGRPCWLFLDEPVSALDISHQLVVMALLQAFATAGGGVVAVMHDLNLTAMFASNVALMKDGRLLADGPPDGVLRDDLLSHTYGCALRTKIAPTDDRPWLLPHVAGPNGPPEPPVAG